MKIYLSIIHNEDYSTCKQFYFLEAGVLLSFNMMSIQRGRLT